MTVTVKAAKPHDLDVDLRHTSAISTDLPVRLLSDAITVR